MVDAIKNYGLMHWRVVTVKDCIDLGRLYRICFKIKKVKANEFCNTKNREIVEWI
jgi:hypothetical protein